MTHGAFFTRIFMRVGAGRQDWLYFHALRLYTAPSRARLTVFEDHSSGEKVLADAVRLGEVPALASALPVPNQGFDFRGVQPRLKERVGIALQDAEKAAERAQQRPERFLARVDLCREIEEHRDGLGRVEVVVHRLLEAPRMRVVPIERRRLAHGPQRGVQARQRSLRLL